MEPHASGPQSPQPAGNANPQPAPTARTSAAQPMDRGIPPAPTSPPTSPLSAVQGPLEAQPTVNAARSQNTQPTNNPSAEERLGELTIKEIESLHTLPTGKARRINVIIGLAIGVGAAISTTKLLLAKIFTDQTMMGGFLEKVGWGLPAAVACAGTVFACSMLLKLPKFFYGKELGEAVTTFDPSNALSDPKSLRDYISNIFERFGERTDLAEASKVVVKLLEYGFPLSPDGKVTVTPLESKKCQVYLDRLVAARDGGKDRSERLLPNRYRLEDRVKKQLWKAYYFVTTGFSAKKANERSPIAIRSANVADQFGKLVNAFVKFYRAKDQELGLGRDKFVSRFSELQQELQGVVGVYMNEKKEVKTTEVADRMCKYSARGISFVQTSAKWGGYGSLAFAAYNYFSYTPWANEILKATMRFFG